MLMWVMFNTVDHWMIDTNVTKSNILLQYITHNCNFSGTVWKVDAYRSCLHYNLGSKRWWLCDRHICRTPGQQILTVKIKKRWRLEIIDILWTKYICLHRESGLLVQGHHYTTYNDFGASFGVNGIVLSCVSLTYSNRSEQKVWRDP